MVPRTLSQQIKLQHVIKDHQVYHLLVSKEEFQRIWGHTFLPARSFSAEDSKIRSFQASDDLWEIVRFKGENPESIDKKMMEWDSKIIKLSFYIWDTSLNQPLELYLSDKSGCPVCHYSSRKMLSVGEFSPYSPLGACSSCQGFGANLIYDQKKLINSELSVLEGGLVLLKYAPFKYAFDELIKILRKKKIPLDQPISELPSAFFDIVEKGEGFYPGFTELKNDLHNMRYKPSVRIYIRHLQKEEPCTKCDTTRLDSKILNYKIVINNKKWDLRSIMKLSLLEALEVFKSHQSFSSTHEKKLFSTLVEKLQVATEMGLGHLRLLRKAKSLSAGEYQRLLLVKYLSFQGTDSLFVLDEPALGLGENEIAKLLKGFRQIIDQGNTVIIIDHNEILQRASDHLIMMGPGSGKDGGSILYQGDPKNYFKKSEKFETKVVKKSQRYPEFIDVKKPSIFGKTYSDIKIPIHDLTWVKGSSGTGKTATLIKILGNSLYHDIHQEWLDESEFSVESIHSPVQFEDILIISSELNRFTSRSSVGTLTELAPVIRKHFLKLPMVKSMGLKEGHLSSNSELGMCSRCEGRGSLLIEMQYLEDIVLECEECKGLKIKPLYAQISDGRMTLAEAYNLPLNQVLSHIDLTPKFRRVWEYIKILNLDYLSLDRSLNSLSGGEKQRIYLLSKLLKSVQNSLLIFENISFGLSVRELSSLGTFLQEMSLFQNTILVIDSSPVFKNLASWQLDFDTKKINLLPLR